ncbi:MAG TPA: hypothetical protein VN300_11845 [Desulfobacterales bacterium]|nr:hypothetical protein [Desulfobacterales bacterium]
MPRHAATEIYKIKKSAEGFIVSFRRGTDHGIRPGMQLTVVNEEGFRVGVVEVLESTESESEALVSGESGVKLGCLVSIPNSF